MRDHKLLRASSGLTWGTGALQAKVNCQIGEPLYLHVVPAILKGYY
jgi:hypothetical protein